MERSAALVREDLRSWIRQARFFKHSDICWAAECRFRIEMMWDKRHTGF